MQKKATKYKRIAFYLFLIYFLVSLFVNLQDKIFTHFFKEKIWAHRVNSIEKLKEANLIFEGIELDVVFNGETNTFDVNHPPAKSINLTLQKYLSSIKLDAKNTFWIDFKNLTKHNNIDACLRLDALCLEFKLKKEQLIIESKKPQYLNVFYKKRYRTSFYLPANLVRLNQRKLIEEIEGLQDVILENKTTYLSTDKRDYRVLKKYFPDQKLLIWTFYSFNKKTINPYHVLYGLNNIYHKLRVLPDKNVSAVLYKYEAIKENR